mmetsp:Transcript_3977/g.11523  ORF Transcript_3977/g.11523 Transcript_3977/m.11523 type:complete len:110 (-) Transcript_3977:1094-1423(-)
MRSARVEGFTTLTENQSRKVYNASHWLSGQNDFEYIDRFAAACTTLSVGAIECQLRKRKHLKIRQSQSVLKYGKADKSVSFRCPAKFQSHAASCPSSQSLVNFLQRTTG